MFKLCYNSTTLRNIDLLEALRLIKDYGYDGVELMLNDTHLHPLKSSRERISEVKRFCADNEINIVCVAAGGPTVLGSEAYEPSLISPEARGRAVRLDFIKRSLALANELDTPVLNINSGKRKPEVSPEHAHDLLSQAIHLLLGHAGDQTLVIEPEPDFFIGTSVDAVKLIRDIGSPKFRLNLDIGHVFCSESDCYDHIEKALPYSRHIHIEDIRNNVHHHEIPGEGDIDFKRIVSLLKQSGYDYYVSVELHHHDGIWQRALKESRDYLLELM